jgi:protein involved in polysaccharide export with SLBB domain
MYQSIILLVVLHFAFPSYQAQTEAGSSETQSANNQTDSKQTPASREAKPEAKRLYEDGIARMKMGQVSEALERFQHALEIDPEYWEAYSGLGRAFFKLKQWENAVGPLRRASELKKEQERQDTLQKDHKRSIESGVTPTTRPPKPQRTNSNGAETIRPGLVSIKTEHSEQPDPRKLIPATPEPKLNHSLPTPAIMELAAETLVSETKPPEPRLEAVAQVNINVENSPPPPLLTTTKAAVDLQIAVNVPPSAPIVEVERISAASSKASSDEIALTKIYRVGPKDILNVRLNSSQPDHTTTFIVTGSGLLEYPHLSNPLMVTGLTVDEIQSKIETQLKNQELIENPKVFVGVLEYASHSIVVDGLVRNPGTRLLKSEAVPLAAILAEAQPLSESARVTVTRNGLNQILETNLSRAADMSFLVQPGDVVTLAREVDGFFYVGGKVKFRGEKRYRFGLTLTQVIITAGGATSNSKVAEITRDGEMPTRFDLNAIESGKAVDPLVKPGDRIILH